MESYGEILRKAREEKGLDYAAISKETSISRDYLKGLEEEDTAVFPGEPYLVGFLRNYAEYLGVDHTKLLTLYHAKQLQETPPPLALTKREKPVFLAPLLVILGLILGAGIVVLVFFIFASQEKKVEENIEIAKGNTFKKYELTEKTFQGRVYKGDQFVLGSADGNIILTVAATEGIFGLETPSGVQYVELSEESELDVDGDSKPELILYVADVSQKNMERGSEIRLMLKDPASAAATLDTSLIPTTEELPKGQVRTDIFSDTRAYPFTVNAVFRAGCLMRYRPDRKEVNEDFYDNGDTLNITVSNGLRIWISNGNSVKLQIAANGKTYDIPTSKPGAVVAQDIRWIKDSDGRFKVVVAELE